MNEERRDEEEIYLSLSMPPDLHKQDEINTPEVNGAKVKKIQASSGRSQRKRSEVIARTNTPMGFEPAFGQMKRGLVIPTLNLLEQDHNISQSPRSSNGSATQKQISIQENKKQIYLADMSFNQKSKSGDSEASFEIAEAKIQETESDKSEMSQPDSSTGFSMNNKVLNDSDNLSYLSRKNPEELKKYDSRVPRPKSKFHSFSTQNNKSSKIEGMGTRQERDSQDEQEPSQEEYRFPGINLEIQSSSSIKIPAHTELQGRKRVNPIQQLDQEILSESQNTSPFQMEPRSPITITTPSMNTFDYPFTRSSAHTGLRFQANRNQGALINDSQPDVSPLQSNLYPHFSDQHKSLQVDDNKRFQKSQTEVDSQQHRLKST